jgi:hypothetical protein
MFVSGTAHLPTVTDFNAVCNRKDGWKMTGTMPLTRRENSCTGGNGGIREGKTNRPAYRTPQSFSFTIDVAWPRMALVDSV